MKENRLVEKCRELGIEPDRIGEWLAEQLNSHGSYSATAKSIGVSRQTLRLYVSEYRLCKTIRWAQCQHLLDTIAGELESPRAR